METLEESLSPFAPFTPKSGTLIRELQIRGHFLGPKNRDFGGTTVLTKYKIKIPRTKNVPFIKNRPQFGGGGSSTGPLSRFYVLFGLAVRRAFPVAGEMSHKPPSVYQFSQDRKEGRKKLSAFFSFLSLISSTAKQF